MKETLDHEGNVYVQLCECDEEGPGTCDYHAAREWDDPIREWNEGVRPVRTLTFTLDGGREVMVTILSHGEVTVAERARSDHSISWGPPISCTSDTA